MYARSHGPGNASGHLLRVAAMSRRADEADSEAVGRKPLLAAIHLGFWLDR
jgi:hypothetical protein